MYICTSTVKFDWFSSLSAVLAGDEPPLDSSLP